MRASQAIAATAFVVAGCQQPSSSADVSQTATLVTQCSLSAQHIPEWASLAEERSASEDQKDRIKLAADVCSQAQRAIRGTELEAPCGPVVGYLTAVHRTLSNYAEGRFVPDFGQTAPDQPSGTETQACLAALSPFSSQVTS